jgi:hypothetical protein
MGPKQTKQLKYSSIISTRRGAAKKSEKGSTEAEKEGEAAAESPEKSKDKEAEDSVQKEEDETADGGKESGEAEAEEVEKESKDENSHEEEQRVDEVIVCGSRDEGAEDGDKKENDENEEPDNVGSHEDTQTEASAKEDEEKTSDPSGVFLISDDAQSQEELSAELKINTNTLVEVPKGRSPDDKPKRNITEIIQKRVSDEFGGKPEDAADKVTDSPSNDIENTDASVAEDSEKSIETTKKDAPITSADLSSNTNDCEEGHSQQQQAAKIDSSNSSLSDDAPSAYQSGVAYKENLEKLVESCKEKLGIDAVSLQA